LATGLLFVLLAVVPARADELKDLYFGEAIYYARQGQFFEALERLDTEIWQYYILKSKILIRRLITYFN